MTRRRSSPRRRRSFLKRFRKSKPRVPIETLVAAGMIPFTPAVDGWKTIFQGIQEGNMGEVANQLKAGFLGMSVPGGDIDFGRLLNPFDFNSGRFTKMLIASAIIGSVRAKFTGRYTRPVFDMIPFIGKKIK